MTRQITQLTHHWRMTPTNGFHQGNYTAIADDRWVSCVVPSHWQSEPLFRQYVGRMVYQTRFAAHIQPDRRYWLRLNGVFYYCRAWLNDQELGRYEGYFTPHTCEVTHVIAADNTLTLEVSCPEEHDKVNKRLITGVFSHWDSLDSTTNPGGVWLPVELIETGPAHIRNLLLTTHHIAPHQAELRFRLQTDAVHACRADVHWRFAPRNFAGKVHTLTTTVALAARQHEASGLLHIPDPQLWWSHDLGHPALYQVTATLIINGQISDEVSFDFGIRTFEMKNWIPYLNGRRFFMKGNNYPPTDTRIATTTRARCAEDIRLARECHMNVLRVHAHVAHPDLYAEADAQGMLIWQDFPLQWIYRREVLEPAKRQVREMVQLLHNHPSVVIWCMHNEAVHVASTSDERLLTKLRTYWSVFVWNWNRDVLDTTLQHEVAVEDSSRPSVRSSGEYAIPLWHKGTDTHFYYGWYMIYGKLATWQQLIKRFPANTRFVTEFGAQSFPNHESAVRFMDADVHKIDWAKLQRQHSFQPDILAYWMDWRRATDLHQLIALTQQYQSHINRHYIDRLRLRKYRPTGGIVPFMFHDANPAVSWSILDYWRVPKQSYYAMQMAFRPQYLFCVVESETLAHGTSVDIPIMVVNDAPHEVAVTIEIRLCAPDDRELVKVRHTRTLPSDAMAMRVDELRLQPDMPGHYRVQLQMRSAHDEMAQEYLITVSDA
ncbi:MAG: glycoside hydrolase [Chloroflexi bacterium]|nr:glycoside hydrolase [Chloroflexota bacterium]